MNREFLQHYNRELTLLHERSKAFAEEFPGVADRLGGLDAGGMDPGVKALLEGTAFMAARVQMKLKSEFSTFTTALLEQVLPGFLAPIPSVALVEARPPFEDAAAGAMRHVPAGSSLEAVYNERERRVSCGYRTTADLEIWPLHLEAAQYLASPAQFGIEVAAGTVSGLRLALHRRTRAPGGRGAGPDDDPGAPVNRLTLDALTVHLTGAPGDAIGVYELLFAGCRRISLRWQDERGDPQIETLVPDALSQIGFDPAERLFGTDDRVFSGFELLREFFVFPAKFLGFRLSGLSRKLAAVTDSRFELLFEFAGALPRLQSTLGAKDFALAAVPAVNLFEMTCSRIPLRAQDHEFHVVPDRSRPLDFEAHKVLGVFAHYPRTATKVEVYPLYSIPPGPLPIAETHFYTSRRLPRRIGTKERREGPKSRYRGTETYLSLREPTSATGERARELSVRCLVSNRHLSEHLPVGAAGADFVLVDDTSIALSCVGRPTPPRDSLLDAPNGGPGAPPYGPRLWALINALSLNHLGLSDRAPGDGAKGLRELLAIFADLSDGVTERRIRAIVSVETRPVVQRLRRPDGFNAARGMEVKVRLDETAFEGSGVFLFGAVLDRFLADYAGLNSFTQTVIETEQRGVLKRWPPRSGTGAVL